MANMQLGQGGRFAKLVKQIKGRKGFKPRIAGQTEEEAASAIAAKVGRAKYGKVRFQAMAVKARTRK